MAIQVIEILFDSLDERIKNGVEDVVFFHPLTGEKLEIQLGEANRKHFANHLEKLQKYIDAATVVEVPVVEAKPKAAAKNSENAKVRTWAKANGFAIGDRGRISAEIQEAYKAAHEVIDSTEQANVEPVDAELGKLIDEVDSRQDEAEADMERPGQLAPEAPSTETEIMEAYEAGHLTAQAVMELLDEVSGTVDESTDTE